MAGKAELGTEELGLLLDGGVTSDGHEPIIEFDPLPPVPGDQVLPAAGALLLEDFL